MPDVHKPSTGTNMQLMVERFGTMGTSGYIPLTGLLSRFSLGQTKIAKCSSGFHGNEWNATRNAAYQ